MKVRAKNNSAMEEKRILVFRPYDGCAGNMVFGVVCRRECQFYFTGVS